eukprot:7643-Heterococcus_DN1.PRE.6
MQADSEQATAQLTSENLLQGGSIVLKLIFQTLGRGCCLPVSLVCKDWKNKYMPEHSTCGTATYCQPYLENA